MPAKVKKAVLSNSGRRPRRSEARSLNKSSTQRKTRSLSERRLQSLTKDRKSVRRLSVAPKSDSRPSQKVSLSASVYDLKGKAVGRISLPSEIFGVEEKPKLLSQYVRVYLANQRMGTVSTKTRGEVRGSTRKIYRQKGTGRARHGGIRAPIFVHGGIAHGPRPRDFSLSLPQKMKRLSLFSALSSKLSDGEIKFVEINKIEPKTKIMVKALKNLDFSGKILLVTPGGMNEFKNIFLSARNLPAVKISTAQTLNAYDVLDNKILFMRDSLDILKKHFLGGKS